MFNVPIGEDNSRATSGDDSDQELRELGTTPSSTIVVRRRTPPPLLPGSSAAFDAAPSAAAAAATQGGGEESRWIRARGLDNNSSNIIISDHDNNDSASLVMVGGDPPFIGPDRIVGGRVERRSDSNFLRTAPQELQQQQQQQQRSSSGGSSHAIPPLFDVQPVMMMLSSAEVSVNSGPLVHSGSTVEGRDDSSRATSTVSMGRAGSTSASHHPAAVSFSEDSALDYDDDDDDDSSDGGGATTPVGARAQRGKLYRLAVMREKKWKEDWGEFQGRRPSTFVADLPNELFNLVILQFVPALYHLGLRLVSRRFTTLIESNCCFWVRYVKNYLQLPPVVALGCNLLSFSTPMKLHRQFADYPAPDDEYNFKSCDRGCMRIAGSIHSSAQHLSFVTRTRHLLGGGLQQQPQMLRGGAGGGGGSGGGVISAGWMAPYRAPPPAPRHSRMGRTVSSIESGLDDEDDGDGAPDTDDGGGGGGEGRGTENDDEATEEEDEEQRRGVEELVTAATALGAGSANATRRNRRLSFVASRDDSGMTMMEGPPGSSSNSSRAGRRRVGAITALPSSFSSQAVIARHATSNDGDDDDDNDESNNNNNNIFVRRGEQLFEVTRRSSVTSVAAAVPAVGSPVSSIPPALSDGDNDMGSGSGSGASRSPSFINVDDQDDEDGPAEENSNISSSSRMVGRSAFSRQAHPLRRVSRASPAPVPLSEISPPLTPPLSRPGSAAIINTNSNNAAAFLLPDAGNGPASSRSLQLSQHHQQQRIAAIQQRERARIYSYAEVGRSPPLSPPAADTLAQTDARPWQSWQSWMRNGSHHSGGGGGGLLSAFPFIHLQQQQHSLLRGGGGGGIFERRTMEDSALAPISAVPLNHQHTGNSSSTMVIRTVVSPPVLCFKGCAHAALCTVQKQRALRDVDRFHRQIWKFVGGIVSLHALVPPETSFWVMFPAFLGAAVPGVFALLMGSNFSSMHFPAAMPSLFSPLWLFVPCVLVLLAQMRPIVPPDQHQQQQQTAKNNNNNGNAANDNNNNSNNNNNNNNNDNSDDECCGVVAGTSAFSATCWLKTCCGGLFSSVSPGMVRQLIAGAFVFASQLLVYFLVFTQRPADSMLLFRVNSLTTLLHTDHFSQSDVENLAFKMLGNTTFAVSRPSACETPKIIGGGDAGSQQAALGRAAPCQWGEIPAFLALLPLMLGVLLLCYEAVVFVLQHVPFVDKAMGAVRACDANCCPLPNPRRLTVDEKRLMDFSAVADPDQLVRDVIAGEKSLTALDAPRPELTRLVGDAVNSTPVRTLDERQYCTRSLFWVMSMPAMACALLLIFVALWALETDGHAPWLKAHSISTLRFGNMTLDKNEQRLAEHVAKVYMYASLTVAAAATSAPVPTPVPPSASNTTAGARSPSPSVTTTSVPVNVWLVNSPTHASADWTNQTRIAPLQCTIMTGPRISFLFLALSCALFAAVLIIAFACSWRKLGSRVPNYSVPVAMQIVVFALFAVLCIVCTVALWRADPTEAQGELLMPGASIRGGTNGALLRSFLSITADMTASMHGGPVMTASQPRFLVGCQNRFAIPQDVAIAILCVFVLAAIANVVNIRTCNNRFYNIKLTKYSLYFNDMCNGMASSAFRYGFTVPAAPTGSANDPKQEQHRRH